MCQIEERADWPIHNAKNNQLTTRIWFRLYIKLQTSRDLETQIYKTKILWKTLNKI
jgi:hypothetical protein